MDVIEEEHEEIHIACSDPAGFDPEYCESFVGGLGCKDLDTCVLYRRYKDGKAD